MICTYRTARFAVLSTLALLLGLAILLTPRSASAQEAFEPARFSVEVTGEGPDAIFIPGLSTSREVWRDAVADLEGYRVHLVQVRGFGEDAGMNAQGEVLVPLVAELARYIEAEQMEAPAIIGHSVGGLTAMTLAAKHPDLPGRVMIVDALPWIAHIFVPPGTEPQMDAMLARGEMMRRMMAGGWTGQRGPGAPEQMLRTQIADPASMPRLLEITDGVDTRVSGQLIYDALTADMRENIASITAPVTVMVPVRPDFLPAATVERFYRAQYAALPDADFVTIAHAGHFVMLDQPDEFRDALAVFLAD
ncbi:alpha/beta fold hydrolase [Aurantiacibacter aquimixticola]|uniref:Alpha/beta hydrolase n=1 Tax=Aurantiacibacter aquimixticola TaxID=1958945 RepID=A0A419RU40_9SPHN|nr:alpha/beta hydrolase [Aurantiacibacter aquimixticola]RJY09305.1 alpha/beta hydrolase [Aurantiacibacter aquimixticola]